MRRNTKAEIYVKVQCCNHAPEMQQWATPSCSVLPLGLTRNRQAINDCTSDQQAVTTQEEEAKSKYGKYFLEEEEEVQQDSQKEEKKKYRIQ